MKLLFHYSTKIGVALAWPSCTMLVLPMLHDRVWSQTRLWEGRREGGNIQEEFKECGQSWRREQRLLQRGKILSIERGFGSVSHEGGGAGMDKLGRE